MRELVLFYSSTLPSSLKLLKDGRFNELVQQYTQLKPDVPFKSVRVDDDATRAECVAGNITRLPVLMIDTGSDFTRMVGCLRITHYLKQLVAVEATPTPTDSATPLGDEEEEDDDELPLDTPISDGPVFDFLRNTKELILTDTLLSPYDHIITKGVVQFEPGCDPEDYAITSVTHATLKLIPPILEKNKRYLIVSDSNAKQLLRKVVQALYEFHIDGKSLEEVSLKHELKGKVLDVFVDVKRP